MKVHEYKLLIEIIIELLFNIDDLCSLKCSLSSSERKVWKIQAAAQVALKTAKIINVELTVLFLSKTKKIHPLKSFNKKKKRSNRVLIFPWIGSSSMWQFSQISCWRKQQNDSARSGNLAWLNLEFLRCHGRISVVYDSCKV